MKKIKFRVWDKEEEYMYEFGLNDIADGYILGTGKRLDNLSEPMQYTGLKDKNGVEIYEGDIVDVPSFTPSKYEVVFDRGGFCLKYGEGRNYCPDIKYAEASTVLGNIYEWGL